MSAARVLNIVEHLVMKNMNEEERRNFQYQLNSPLERQRTDLDRTVRRPPAWWHGDEEAEREAQGVMGFLKGT